jgi:hypothetical protein
MQSACQAACTILIANSQAERISQADSQAERIRKSSHQKSEERSEEEASYFYYHQLILAGRHLLHTLLTRRRAGPSLRFHGT